MSLLEIAIVMRVELIKWHVQENWSKLDKELLFYLSVGSKSQPYPTQLFVLTERLQNSLLILAKKPAYNYVLTL